MINVKNEGEQVSFEIFHSESSFYRSFFFHPYSSTLLSASTIIIIFISGIGMEIEIGKNREFPSRFPSFFIFYEI
jgi:hypothetical protein